MAFWNIRDVTASGAGYVSSTRDSGLRAYFIAVYKYMMYALATSGVTAYLVSLYIAKEGGEVFVSMMPITIIAQLVVVFYLSMRISRMSSVAARNWFWVYSVLTGISLGSIFIVYTNESVMRVFFVAASIFGALSIYGYTTKRDLTSIGSFMHVGLFGIIIVGLLNLFFRSTAVSLMISVTAVVIFVGLIAYDVQRLKDIYLGYVGYDNPPSVNDEVLQKIAIHGALVLYLDFINLFINLLRLLGTRRN